VVKPYVLIVFLSLIGALNLVKVRSKDMTV